VRLKHVAQVTAALVVTLLAAAVLPLRRASPTIDSSTPHMIALINHGYHMGLVVPVRSATYDLAAEFGLSGDGEVVEIGWGDSTFYTMKAGFNVVLGANALFGGSHSSVLHLQLRHRDSLNDVPLTIGDADLRGVVQRLRSTAQRTADGRPWIIGHGYGGESSAFVMAHGTYSILRTCNQWTSDVLLATGRSMPLWCPLPHSVLWNVEVTPHSDAMLQP
jgi:uncharacterized protein (TIGR02117 family)